MDPSSSSAEMDVDLGLDVAMDTDATTMEDANDTFLYVNGEMFNFIMNNGSHNIAVVINSTNDEELLQTLKRFQTNLIIDGWLLYTLIFLYALLIVFGTVGNLLTVCAVVRKSSMRTPRNMFIINLAVSDLLLCVITMPVTLIQTVTAMWSFGPYEVLCKAFSSLHAISIFVSTISITAIALDRYHVIVYPTKASVQRVGAILAVMCIWALALLLSTPLITWSKIKRINSFSEILQKDITYCYEDWPIKYGRAFYSFFSIIIQYTVPISVVSIAYCRICKKLRYRMKPGCRPVAMTTTGQAVAEQGGNSGGAGRRSGGSIRKDQVRVRRTNLLLVSIAVIFGISWMPLNVLNLVLDLFPGYLDTWAERVVFAFCHMFGMSSANTNPLLYGFFNDNFRKEFKDIWNCLKRKVGCGGGGSGSCWIFGGADNGINLGRGRSVRGDSRGDREQTATVHYRKSLVTCSKPDGEMEQSTLITQVLDRQK